MSTSKRGHHEGTVYRDKSTGRWVAEISAGYDDSGRRRRRKRKARTKAEALAKLRTMQRELDDGLPAGRASMTVAELLDFFIDTVVASRGLSPNTVDNYIWARSHLKPALGRRRIKELTAEEVERFLFRRRDECHLSHNSLKRLKSVLTAALREAQRRDWVVRNVGELATVPQSHKRQGRALTVEEAHALLRAAQDDRLEAAILVGLTRGLRPGEILGLQWRDFDLDAEVPTMSIRRALKRENGKLLLGSTKTQKSNRTLVLPTPAVDALRAHRRRQTMERLANADVWSDLDLVFCTSIGTLVDPSNFRGEFKKLTRAAGLGALPPYDLRHSAVSILSVSGVPIEQLVDLLGHIDSRTLISVYRHQVTPALMGGADIAAAVFSPGAAAGE